jgi:ABC-type Fe2+-enterobactin transport system substrate-binding protein
VGDDVLVPIGIDRVWGVVEDVYNSAPGLRVVVRLGDDSTIMVPAADVQRMSPTITIDEVVEGLQAYLSTVGRRRAVDPDNPAQVRLRPVDYLRITLMNLREIQKREKEKRG